MYLRRAGEGGVPSVPFKVHRRRATTDDDTRDGDEEDDDEDNDDHDKEDPSGADLATFGASITDPTGNPTGSSRATTSLKRRP